MERKVEGGVIIGYVGEEKAEPIVEAPIEEEKKAPAKKAKK